jgi:hypothetical protein
MWVDDKYRVGAYQADRPLQIVMEINECRRQASSTHMEGL